MLFLLLCAAASPARGEGGLPVGDLRYEVLATYPHDPEAFTQGLLFDGGRFFESTGLYGHSTLREVDPASGRILRIEHLPDPLFGEGLAAYGDRLIQLTWRARLGLVYDKSSFKLLQALPIASDGWGLTAHGPTLVMSDGTSRIRFLDPGSLRTRRFVDVKDGDRPVQRLNELEMIRGRLWANIWQTDRIVIIDVTTGRVLARLDLKGLLAPGLRRGPDAVLNGIAWDPDKDRIFVTGKLWPKMFEIRVFSKDRGG